MQQEININLGELFRFLWRGLLLALLTGAVLGGAAYWLSQQQETVYWTRATVVAAHDDADLRSFGFSLLTAPPLDISAYRTAALSDPVLRNALSRVGVEEVEPGDIARLRNKLNVRTEDMRTSGLVHLEMTDGSPEEAATLANAVALALVEWDRNRANEILVQGVGTLEGQIAAADERIAALRASGAASEQIQGWVARQDELQEQLYYARALGNSAVGRLNVIQPAPIPTGPISPRPVFNAALAFALGFILAYGGLLLRELLNTRLRNVDDLSAASGLPVLAAFPKVDNTRHLPVEAANYLRTNLLFATADSHPKVILVTSPQAGNGRSSVAISLAESFSRTDARTLLVDADLRNPVIAKEYDLDPKRHAPLRSYLENPYESYEPAYVAVNLTHHLDVVPSFEASPSPTELLSRTFAERLGGWKGDYDVIVIDSAPLLEVADTLTIAPHCTGTVLVTSMDTDRRQLGAAVELLERTGIRLLGVAATFVTTGGRQNSYHKRSEREQPLASGAPATLAGMRQKRGAHRGR